MEVGYDSHFTNSNMDRTVKFYSWEHNKYTNLRFGRMRRVCVRTVYLALSKYKASYLLNKTDDFLNKRYVILDLKYGLFITHTHTHTHTHTQTHIH